MKQIFSPLFFKISNHGQIATDKAQLKLNQFKLTVQI